MRLLNRRKLLQIGAAGTAAGIFAPHVARAAPTVLRISSPDSATHPNFTMLSKYGDLVKERTGGAIEIKIFPDGQLGSMANALTGIQTGTIDFAISGPSNSEGIYPKLGVLGLPFMFANEQVAEKVLDGEIGTTLAGDMQKFGMEILCWSTWGWRVTETRDRPIREPKDFQGLKIRLPPGPVYSDTFKTLGAIPTVVDATELYLAVSQGTVDAFEVPFLSLVASKWYEVVKFVSLTNHTYNPIWLAMSKLRMDSLPAEHQKVLRDTAKELQPEWRTYNAKVSLDSQKFIEDRGIEVVPVDTAPFKEVLMPVYDRVKEKIGADIVDQVMKASAA